MQEINSQKFMLIKLKINKLNKYLFENMFFNITFFYIFIDSLNMNN